MRWSTCSPVPGPSAPSAGGYAPGSSQCSDQDIVVLSGAPIREPIAWAGPFMMNTRAEIIAAFETFQAGRLGTIPAQHLPHSDVGAAASSQGFLT